MTATITGFLQGKNPKAVEMFKLLRKHVLALGDVDERVHKSEVAWARARVFAAGFIYGSRLEIAIDLLREVDHPNLRQAFATTKRVVTHRLSLTDKRQIDAEIIALLKEAYETVGPGTGRPTAGSRPDAQSDKRK